MPTNKKPKNTDFYDKFAQEYDDGDGMEVIVGDVEPGGEVKVKRFFSNELPKLRIRSHKSERTLDMEFSSNESDDKKLLHHLFQKTKSK